MLDFSVTFIITIINIAILFFVLRAVLFKPVTKLMADRAKSVQETIEQAQSDREQARKLLVEYEARLKKAAEEAELILKTSREDAARQTERMIAEGKEQAANIIVAAQKQIEAEQQAALAKFKMEAATLVMAAVSQLAAKEISGEDKHRYVNILLSGISDEFAAKKGRI